MIDYTRLSTGTPRDVEVTTDDGDAEMAALQDMITECGFEVELPTARDDDGNFRFTIPGTMAGEFGECAVEIDDGKLEELTDKWNQETVEAAEG